MAKSFFAVCHFFAVRFLVADGKELLCRPLADDKELADGKVPDSSSVLPSALPKPPKFLVLLEVKLLHAFESRALFKQRRKWGKL